jgi:hypothetical protein
VELRENSFPALVICDIPEGPFWAIAPVRIPADLRFYGLQISLVADGEPSPLVCSAAESFGGERQ